VELRVAAGLVARDGGQVRRDAAVSIVAPETLIEPVISSVRPTASAVWPNNASVTRYPTTAPSATLHARSESASAFASRSADAVVSDGEASSAAADAESPGVRRRTLRILCEGM
jgi:hypothetical protein